MRHLPTQRPSKKLDYPTNGPFKIVEKIGHSYRLDLPTSMRIHDVLPAEKLRRAADNPLPGQVNDPLPPINITGDEEWEVEDILAVRKRWKSLEYRVSWRNHDNDLMWYKASDIKTAPHKLRDFHLANQMLPGPPAKLPQWLRLFEDGEDNYDYADSDFEMEKDERKRFFEVSAGK
jgi:hypothetical protein